MIRGMQNWRVGAADRLRKTCRGELIVRIFHVDAFTRTRFGQSGHRGARCRRSKRGDPERHRARIRERRNGLRVRAERHRSRFHLALLQCPQGGAVRRPRDRGGARRAARARVAAAKGPAGRSREPESSRSTCCRSRRATANTRSIEFRQSSTGARKPAAAEDDAARRGGAAPAGVRLHELLPARIARKGSSRLLLPVADTAALDELAPNFESLLAIGREIGAEGFFVFAHRREPQAHVDRVAHVLPGARNSRRSGQRQRPRDARVLFAGTRHHRSRQHPASSDLQGRQMHRPGQVRVKLEFAGGTLNAVRIGGNAVIVSEGD
jgi:hypothetical protein